MLSLLSKALTHFIKVQRISVGMHTHTHTRSPVVGTCLGDNKTTEAAIPNICTLHLSPKNDATNLVNGHGGSSRVTTAAANGVVVATSEPIRDRIVNAERICPLLNDPAELLYCYWCTHRHIKIHTRISLSEKCQRLIQPQLNR